MQQVRYGHPHSKEPLRTTKEPAARFRGIPVERIVPALSKSLTAGCLPGKYYTDVDLGSQLFAGRQNPILSETIHNTLSTRRRL